MQIENRQLEDEVKSLCNKLDRLNALLRQIYSELKIYAFKIFIWSVFCICCNLFIFVCFEPKYLIYVGIVLGFVNFFLCVGYLKDIRIYNMRYKEADYLMERLMNIAEWSRLRKKYLRNDDNRITNTLSKLILQRNRFFSPIGHNSNQLYHLMIFVLVFSSLFPFVLYVWNSLNN